jgi:aminopeptidase N
MLRFELGDSCFFNALRNYYSTNKYSNASTDDFKMICEEESGKNLDKFFDQWIYKGDEVPQCDYSYEIDKRDDEIFCNIKIDQKLKKYSEFNFPLEIEFKYEDGYSETAEFYIDSISKTFNYQLVDEPEDVVFDPDNVNRTK